MTATLKNLLAVRSRFADEIVAFCDEAIAVLDVTPFHFCDANGGGASRAISISGTVIDARVFTWREKASDREDREPGLPRRREGGEADAPATEYEKKLADLNEHPWQTEGRESIPWSRALDRAKRQQPLRPLVVRGAPGGGKTTLSRASTVQRLKAARAALVDCTRLPEGCEPMLWTTCTALAQAECPAGDPADLVITAAFDALKLPAGHPARSDRVRAWLRARIAAGECPVALDSLDEVVAKDEPNFCDRAPRLLHLHSPLVLTCRVLEWTRWESRLRWSALDPVELAPFTAREQREFTRRFFEEEIKRPDLLSGIRQQLAQKPTLRKACESPILLFFACLLHAGGELSGAATRAGLYELMSRRLFRGEWRGLPKPPQWANGGARECHVIAWLCEIAFALFRAVPEAKEFPLSVWEAAVEDPNAIAAAGKVFPPLHPGELLEDLERCGFLIATGWKTAAPGPKKRQPHYSFPHRSFVAYLAGAALSKRPREVWLKEAIDHLWFQFAWDDVLLFLAGHLNEAAMDALLTEIEKHPEDIFHQRLRWQWRLAGEAQAVSAHWETPWTESALKLAVGDEAFCVVESGGRGEPARTDLLRALGTLGAVVGTPVKALLHSLDAPCAIHMDAAFSFAKLLQSIAIPLSDSRRNYNVVTALGIIGGARVVDDLLSRLHPDREPNGHMLCRIVGALAEMEDSRAVGPLSKLLESLYLAVERGNFERGDNLETLFLNSVEHALGRIGCDARTVNALVARLDPLRETSGEVRRNAAGGLGVIGDLRAVEALLQSLDPLRESDRGVRIRAAVALDRICDDRAVEALLQSLDPIREPDSEVRDRVAHALGTIGDLRAVEELLKSLDSVREPDIGVRETVAGALCAIGDVRALEALLQSLDPTREPAGRVRARVAEALGAIGDARAVEALLQSLNPGREPEWWVRRQVAIALRIVRDVRVLEALPSLDPMREPYGEVRAEVAEALGAMGDVRAVEALLQSLNPGRESYSWVRMEVAKALGTIGDARAVEALLRSLDPTGEPASGVRAFVAEALCAIGHAGAVEVLRLSLDPAHEPDSFTRFRVAAALAHSGDVPAVEALLRSLDPACESDSKMRGDAARILGLMCDGRTVNALRESLDSEREPERSVREEVAEALFKLYWRLGDRTAFLLEPERRRRRR